MGKESGQRGPVTLHKSQNTRDTTGFPSRGDPDSRIYHPGKLGLSFQTGKLRSRAMNARISAPLAHVPLLELLGCPGTNPSRAATVPAIPTFAEGSGALCQHWSEARTHSESSGLSWVP